MPSLVLQYAGQALGAAIGGPAGAMLGRAAGAIAGQFFDQALLGGKRQSVSGPRMRDFHIQGSTEGNAIPQVFGRVRLSGELIWATNFDEVVSTRTEKSGGKGISNSSKTLVTEYTYYANFAVGICEGEISRIGRVWADGKKIDLSSYTYRVYKGTQDQMPDSLIEAKEGTDLVPAYRGHAYIVFEALPLARFGNRIPQLSFEVFTALDDVEKQIRSVTLIPGLTEFGYDPRPVTRDAGYGETVPENTNSLAGSSDWSIAIDQLEDTCPNIQSVSLVVSWFGDDLRCGQCRIFPGVDNQKKVTSPVVWSVGGLKRSSAHLVSQIDGQAAFGGTPSDSSVIEAILDLKDRGLKVTFYPFINMDIPDANGLEDPYTGATDQPVYPWRGRITCNPAPDVDGTPDKTSNLRLQIESFFGQAEPADFRVNKGSVSYSGSTEWSYRRMVLHYANLCAAAGGVEAFLIGSELRGLTRLRDGDDSYPVVDELISLAGEVANILPDSKISYAADWSEYFGHQPQDGTGDVYFHLDPLWASSNVDFVAIDNYMPLSDWRNGTWHLDAEAGASSIYSQDYLQSNIAGGEGFDWYYAAQEDRDSQVRTTITDETASKPWVFAYKDLASWWSNEHFNRPAGVETSTPTNWEPMSKPVRFTEAGCPAVDKGTNQPNVFVDSKSSESTLPYHSTGLRDDMMQRSYIDAMTTFWSKTDTTANPVSSIYNGPMVDAAEISFWAWDARPYPAFPYLLDVWSDGENYNLGHWLNGRLGAIALRPLVEAIAERYDFPHIDASELSGLLDGYIIDRPMSARAALEPLSLAYFFNAVESGEQIIFRHKDRSVAYTIDRDELVETAQDGPVYEIIRAQETELPAEVSLNYLDNLNDYQKAVVISRRLAGHSKRKASADMPAVLSQACAQKRADMWLQDVWAGRETLTLSLTSRFLALEPGDAICLDDKQYTITEIQDNSARNIAARKIETSIFNSGSGPVRNSVFTRATVFGPAELLFLDLPLMSGDEDPHDGWIATNADPWPGSLNLLRVTDTSSSYVRSIDASATIGDTLWDLYSGPTSRFDRGNRIQVSLHSGALQSVSQSELLAGANLAAIRNTDGNWEILQFQTAELIASDIYEISILLRGQSGTELAMQDPVPAGAPFVLLNGAVVPANLTLMDIGRELTFLYGPASRDIDDASYDKQVHTFSGVGLRPLSPVHVRGVSVSGGFDISWTRRTRISGDSWSQVEVPLGEDAEAYELDILDDEGSIIRTLSASETTVHYAQADILADFGASASTINVKVYQLSASYGRGTPREKTLYV